MLFGLVFYIIFVAANFKVLKNFFNSQTKIKDSTPENVYFKILIKVLNLVWFSSCDSRATLRDT